MAATILDSHLGLFRPAIKEHFFPGNKMIESAIAYHILEDFYLLL